MAKLSCLVVNYNKKDLSSISRHLRFIDESPEAQGDRERNTYPLVLNASPLKTLHKSIFYRVAQRENPERSIHAATVLLRDIQVGCVGEAMSAADILLLFKSAADFLTQRFRQSNRIYAVVHCEENAPHMHFGFVPMTENNRLCAGKFPCCKELQSELSEYLRLTGISIDSNHPVTKAPTAITTPRHRRPETASPQNHKKEDESHAVLEAIHEKVQSLSLQNQQYEEQIGKLYRENQNLKLERIFLNRQLSNLSDILRLNPDMENQFESRVKTQASLKHARHSATSPNNQLFETQMFSEEYGDDMP